MERDQKPRVKPPVAARPVRMECQPHGGALRRGPGGSNRGGPGRPRSEVRQLALQGAAQAVPKLIAIVTDPESDSKDVIAAARVLLEFGLGRQLEIEDVTAAERATGEQQVQWLLDAIPRLLRVLPIDQQRAVVMLQTLKAKEAEFEVEED